jgi:hypothetical protein
MEIEKRLEARRGADYEPTETEGGDLLDQFLDQIERSDQNDPDNYYKSDWINTIFARDNLLNLIGIFNNFRLQYLPAFIYDIFLAGQVKRVANYEINKMYSTNIDNI